MPVAPKSRSANAIRAKADAIRTELLDEARTFSIDEVKSRTDEITVLEARAAAAAGFTPDEEIDRQGGDEDDLLNRRAPNRGDDDGDDTVPNSKRIAQLRKDIEKAFGGTGEMLLALARRSIQPLESRQQTVIRAIQDLQKRTIIGDTGNAAGGEFLLPLQQEQSIFSVQPEAAGIFESARRYAVSGRTLRIPYLVQTDGTVTRPMSGFANVTIVGEAAQKPEREPKFLQRILTVYKWAAYTELGDEMLADDFTGDLSSTVTSVVGGQLVRAMNESVTFDGTGTNEPLGAFNDANTALYKQTRKTANAFTVDDVFNMYSRHVQGPKSRWYIHPSVLPQFMALTLNGTTLVTTMPTLNGAPQMQLLGLPVVVTPLVAVLGAQGDVCLGNADFYALAVRQALTVESSIHYKFRDDITAYRFFGRAGGIPIPTDTFSYKASGGVKVWAVSPFVVLDNVVTV